MDEKVPISVPQPLPKPSGVVVYPVALKVPDQLYPDGGGVHKDISELLQARYTFGLSKYQQPLMRQDGRDDVEDIRQELGDVLMDNKTKLTPLDSIMEGLFRLHA